MEENIREIFISGHRNPDIDSLVAAAALAELRRRQGAIPVRPLCPGVMPERAAWLFNRFRQTPPESRNDVYLRVSDVMRCDLPVLTGGISLLEGVKQLGASVYPRLPVVESDGKFLGMLSPLALLSQLLDVGQSTEQGLTGRRISSSLDLIAAVIDAEKTVCRDAGTLQDFLVYVAAMGLESFEKHLPAGRDAELAVIAGDRPDIHLRVLQRKIRLLIVTGGNPVEPLILSEARHRGVSILRTPLDSATVTRLLKFSVPVERAGFDGHALVLTPRMRLRELEKSILNAPCDVLPVVSEDGKFQGAVLKKTLGELPPYRMILVDHNERAQSLPGVEELPVIEVVDHHRIGMTATASPIKFTGDVVGSTCTLVAGMFRSAGESLTPELAGLLLGGIVADTLNLKSPTAAGLDRRMYEWLEKLSGTRGDTLMEEFSRIGSPLAAKPAAEVIGSDRKLYSEGRFRFALSQAEETRLELLQQRLTELTEELDREREAENLDFIGLLVTDAVRGKSELLLRGTPEVIRNFPGDRGEDGIFDLPGMLSRKKQLLPQVLAVLAALER